ncbi:MAG: DUF2442 domain-containing protein [Chitinivibrionia bacterium]|jgi:hypothetical protein|nr:DUF2442 domain-containing protein [Chitinivibrionia bacterium]
MTKSEKKEFMKFHCYENSSEDIKIVKIFPLDDYKLRIVFSNGKIKIFDFRKELEFPVFKPLKDKTLFNSVKLLHGTAFWKYDWKIKNIANDIDIAPECLYWEGVLENQ